MIQKLHSTTEPLRRVALTLAATVIGASFCSICPADSPQAADGSAIRFQKLQIDSKFRSEGVAVGDFDRDGQPDIAAGSVWYQAPNWQPHPIVQNAPEFNPLNYSESFANFADDVNGDGWTDLVVVAAPGMPTRWFENSKKIGAVWTPHIVAPVSNNESPQFHDIYGDRRRELIMGIAPTTELADGPDRQMAILRSHADSVQPWSAQTISAKAAPGTMKYSHGLGAGDINRDGRTDIIVADGWWEAPANAASEWRFHPIRFGKPVADMVVHDFNRDGRPDIACSSAHDVGIWWLEQRDDDQWNIHEIDNSFSQSHSLCLADINGDGNPDLITGKRWWAHGPTGDVQADQPAVLYWFELRQGGKEPNWVPHLIDDNCGVGTQFEVVDIDGDGQLDIATSNKKGVYLFLQGR